MGRTVRPKADPVHVTFDISEPEEKDRSKQEISISGSIDFNITDPSPPEDKFVRIGNEILTYSADLDQVRNHGGGSECVANLGNDGREVWNKWFTGDKHGDQATVSVQLSPPQQVHRYSLCSANDQPSRNPRSFALFGRRKDRQDFELLHEVKDELFTSFWQRRDYDVPVLNGNLFSAIQLRILASQKSGSGLQLGQLLLWKDPSIAETGPGPDTNVSEFDWSFGMGRQAGTDTAQGTVLVVEIDNEQPEDSELDDRKSFKSIRSVGSAFGSIKKKFAKFFLKGTNELFTDPDFPPGADSLFKVDPLAASKGESTSATEDGEFPEVAWRRPSDFIEGDVKVFDKSISYGDIAQGQLGDCWLMCSLAAIAEFEPLVRDLIVLSECNPSTGTYVIRLCKDGSWKRMIVDDLFPCTPNEGPLYSQCTGDEIWVMLVEKAFAKCNGSYASIRTGYPYEAMIDLTGAPFKEFTLTDPVVEEMVRDGSLWSMLVKYDSLNYIMTLSTAGVDSKTEGGDRSGGGLVPGHAYTLISVKQADGLKLCKIRNPWGQFEWAGDWGDKSSLWTEQTKADFGWSDSDDGVFWMSFEDMCKHFVGINACLVRHKGLDTVVWNEDRKKMSYRFSKTGSGVESVPMFKLKVKEDDAEVFITVHQQDKRKIGSPEYIDIGVVVLQETGAVGEYSLVDFAYSSAVRQHQLDLPPGRLPRGSYLVVPVSTGCCLQRLAAHAGPLEDEQYVRQCVLSLHCDKQFSLKELPFDALAYSSALILPVLSSSDTTDLFDDGSVMLYTLRHGFSGCSYAAQNRKKNLHALLELDFTKSVNVTTEDGCLQRAVTIPPGEARLVRHLMPAVDTLPWSAAWGCGGSFSEPPSNTSPEPSQPQADPVLAPISSLKPAASRTGVYERIPSELVFYSADQDQERTHSGGGHEYVHNLGDDGAQDWNKWYSGPPNRAAKFNGEAATITLRLSVPQRIDRYSLVSACDCESRYPKRWEVWGQREGASVTQWERLHVVAAAKFPGHMVQTDYDVKDKDVVGVLFRALQLRITASQAPGGGIQLAQFFLWSKKLRMGASGRSDARGAEDIDTWRPETRVATLHVKGVDGREWDEEKIKKKENTPSKSGSLLDVLIPGSLRRKNARNKYLEADPTSHAHIEKHVAGL